jgi:hypothetical protein
MSAEEELHWLWPAIALAAARTWDYDRWDALSARYVQLARDTGALSELHLALTVRAYALLFAGELTAAALLAEEIQVVKEATGSGLAPYAAFGLAAMRGEEAKALALIGDTMQDSTRRGEGQGSRSPSGQTRCSAMASASTTVPPRRHSGPAASTMTPARCSG